MSPEAEIRRRIREYGPIAFAEFMEVALYWPHGGYYAGGSDVDEGERSPFGESGDYYTSPMAHPAFGYLLAVQLYQFWLLLAQPDPFHVVELGSGNGQLCRDILAAAPALPGGFPDCLRYICLDRGGTLLGTDSQGTSGLIADGLPLRHLTGCILSNELLDAFPVHQARMERGELKEVYVTLDSSHPPPTGRGAGGEDFSLAEVLDNPSTPALAERLQELHINLAEGQTAELNLALDGWAADAAEALDRGFVLTIDYGRLAGELYSAERRPRGTLVTYYRHTQTDAPLRHIGSQDITAQVDFTSVINSGRRVGLEALGYTTQARFLRNLGFDGLRRRVTSTPLPVDQGVANRAGLLSLTRPDGLGDFKALIQGKNVPRMPDDKPPALWGLESSPEALALAAQLPVPLLTSDHISLPQGWPPPAVQEFEVTDLWHGPFGVTE